MGCPSKAQPLRCAAHPISLSTLRTDSEKNQNMIQRQACRLLGLANTEFTDPPNHAQKAELMITPRATA